MEKLTIILLLFFSTLVLGQNKEIHVEIYENGDTSLCYDWQIELCKKIELENIQYSKKPWYFRLSTHSQVLDLYTNEDSSKTGTITSWVKEDVYEDEKPTHRIFYQTINLAPSIVNDLYLLIDSTKIDTIPNENLIEGWEANGLDGVIYIFESANETRYFFKTYWTPYVQKTLKQAVLIQDFIDKALELSNSKIIWTKFSSEIPFECYRFGNSFACWSSLSQRQKRKYKKEREKYRRRLKQ